MSITWAISTNERAVTLAFSIGKTSPRFLSAYGRDVDVPESQLAYDPQTRRLTLVGGSRQDAKVKAALDAVQEVVKSTEGLSGRAIKKALEHSDYSRDTIDAALKYGVRTGKVRTTIGAHRATLYHPSVPVSGSVRPVSAVHSVDRVSECPAAFIEGGHSGHSTDAVAEIETSVSAPDTQRDWLPPGLGGNDGRF